jgi:hypothetical protein
MIDDMPIMAVFLLFAWPAVVAVMLMWMVFVGFGRFVVFLTR